MPFARDVLLVLCFLYLTASGHATPECSEFSDYASHLYTIIGDIT